MCFNILSLYHVSQCRAKLVDIALENGKIYEGEGFKYIKESFENGTLHLIGLLSDGGVHSRLDQLQVSQFCKFQQNVANISDETMIFYLLCVLYILWLMFWEYKLD